MKRALKGLGLALMIMALAAVVAIGVLTWQINRLGGQDLAQPADAIVILGARVNADGSPSSDLLSRTFHGIDLYNAGLAPVVICAGGAGGDRLSAGAVACRYAAEQLGVPADHALVAQEGNAWTTADEAGKVAEMMRANGWRSAIVVSHPLHLFRAKWLFEREGIEVFTSPTNTNLRRIFPPLRAWYSLREAGGVILTAAEELPLVNRLVSWLSERVYG